MNTHKTQPQQPVVSLPPFSLAAQRKHKQYTRCSSTCYLYHNSVRPIFAQLGSTTCCTRITFRAFLLSSAKVLLCCVCGGCECCVMTCGRISSPLCVFCAPRLLQHGNSHATHPSKVVQQRNYERRDVLLSPHNATARKSAAPQFMRSCLNLSLT